MSAPTAPVLGADGIFVVNTGSHNSPTWDEMDNVRDIELSLDFTDVEVTLRAGGGYKAHEPALADISFSTEHLHDPADTQLTTLRNAAIARTMLEVGIMDQDIATAGSQGFTMPVKAFSFKPSQMLDGIMSDAFDWKICYASFTPSYVTVGS